jgi:hypothetical protein
VASVHSIFEELAKGNPPFTNSDYHKNAMRGTNVPVF